MVGAGRGGELLGEFFELLPLPFSCQALLNQCRSETTQGFVYWVTLILGF